MILHIEGTGYCWIATDSTVSEAVVYATCVQGEATGYADLPHGVETSRETAKEELAIGWRLRFDSL